MLLWKKQWDVINVKAPSWNYKYEILGLK
jgi:hypothetical protein